MKLKRPDCRVVWTVLAVLWLSPWLSLSAVAQGRLRRPPASESGGGGGGGSTTGSVATSYARFRQEAGELPAGTLLICRMQTRLNSKVARPGDRFKARVLTPASDGRGRIIVPPDSVVEGHVADVAPAQSRRRSGIIEVGFDRVILPDGQSVRLAGSLAPVTPEDRERMDEDGTYYGKGAGVKRTVAFIGGGVGAGALIGAFTTGAVLGAGLGAGVGVFALWLSKGQEAMVEPGAKIGVELTETLRTYNPSQDVFAEDRTFRPRPPATSTGNSLGNPLRDFDPFAIPPPASSNTGTGSRPGARPTATPQARPSPRPPVSVPIRPIRPDDEPANVSGLPLVDVSNVLAERASDGKLRVSITGRAPTAGWRLAPERSVQGGTLQIRLHGRPPQGMVAQVISYPTTLLTVDDPARQIQRVTVRGQTTARSTVPIVRGGTSTRPGSGDSGGGELPSESFSAEGTRIADKLDALVEDYAKWMRAWRTSEGTYSFENPRDGGTPEAQLLHALDRLQESARVFRGSLTPEVKRRAVRELVNGATQANRLMSFVRIPAEFTQRWQDVQREINQLAATVPGATSPAANTAGRPRQ